MLQLVRNADHNSFEQLVEKFGPLVKRWVLPFSRNRAIAGIEDVDSLYSIALAKLWDVVRSYKYDEEQSDDVNLAKFVAMAKKCIKNKMYDVVHAAGISKRYLHNTVSLQGSIDDDSNFDVADKCSSVYGAVVVSEIEDYVCSRASDYDNVRDIYRLYSSGTKVNNIARKLGVGVSRVSYIVYRVIQPGVSRYIDVCPHEAVIQ